MANTEQEYAEEFNRGELNLTSIFQKDGDLWGSDGKKFYKIELSQSSITQSSSNSTLKVLLALGEGKFSEISTKDVRINNQPLEVYTKQPIIDVRLGTKEQKIIDSLNINDREITIQAEILREEDPLVFILGDEYPVTNADLMFQFPNGLYYINSTNGNRGNYTVEFEISIQQLKEDSNGDRYNIEEPIVEKISLNRAESSKFDHNIQFNFNQYLPTGSKGGIFEFTIKRITGYDGGYTSSKIYLDRIVEYIYVDKIEKISYSDTALAYLEIPAQASLQGSQIPKIEIKTKGAEIESIENKIENTIYGQTQLLNENPVPIDVLNYQPSQRMKEFLSTIKKLYPIGVQKIGEQTNLQVKNISTGEFSTIREIDGDGTIHLRNHIFKSEIGGERFEILIKQFSTNIADQFNDLIKNPDYGIGKSFTNEILNYSNLIEISDECNSLIPIDGNKYMIEGEVDSFDSLNLENDEYLFKQTVELNKINFSSNSHSLDFIEEIVRFIYPNYIEENFNNYWNLNTTNPVTRNTDPINTDTIFNYTPRKIFEQEYNISELVLSDSFDDFFFNINLPNNYNQYMSNQNIYFDDAINYDENFHNNMDDINTYLTRVGYPRLSNNNWLFADILNAPPLIYEITFYGSYQNKPYTKIKTVMVNHRHLPSNPDNEHPSFNDLKYYKYVVESQNLNINLDLYDFINNGLGIVVSDNEVLDNINIKVSVRCIPHLFYYSNNYTNRIEEIEDLESEFASDLSINQNFMIYLLNNYVSSGIPTNQLYRTSITKFITDIYCKPEEIYTQLLSYLPTSTKDNYHATYIRMQDIPCVLIDGLYPVAKGDVLNSPWITSLNPVNYQYQNYLSSDDVDNLSGIVLLKNYKKTDEDNNLIIEDNVDINMLHYVDIVSYKSGNYNPIYKHYTSQEVKISIGDIVYNLNTYEKAVVESFVYTNNTTGKFQSTSENGTLVKNGIKLNPPIFNMNGLEKNESQSLYRIYSKSQCEPKHVSSFAISQFYNPKEYLPTVLSAINGLLVQEGHFLYLNIEGKNKIKESEEVIISETDIVPNSLTIHSKSKKEIPNTIEVSFMNKDNRNQRQSITVRDRNALQGIDETGNVIARQQPERKKQIFYPQIGRISEAIRKANYLLNHEKYVNHIISFSTFGVGSNLRIGDTFQFRSPIMRQGVCGSIVNQVVNGNLSSTNEEMEFILSTPVADLLDGFVIVEGDTTSKYIRDNPLYLGDKDYWCFLMNQEGLVCKLKITEINGLSVKIFKDSTLSNWIDFKHEEFDEILKNTRITIGEKENLATRYRVSRKRKVHLQGTIEFEAHSYIPKVYSDFSSYSILDNVVETNKEVKRSVSDAPYPIKRVYISNYELTRKEIEINDIGIIKKAYNIGFNFDHQSDMFYSTSNVYYKWSNESDNMVKADQNDGWKKLVGSPFTSSFEFKELIKPSEELILQIIVQPISKFGVTLDWETCKKTSLFSFVLKENNESVPFPKDFKATLDEKNLKINLSWTPNKGISTYLIHTKLIENGNELGGDYVWGFDNANKKLISDNTYISTNEINAQNFIFEVPKAGEYQFMIRGKSLNNYYSGELNDFKVTQTMIKHTSSEIDYSEILNLSSDNITYKTSDSSDDLNLLLEILNGETYPLRKAYLTFNTELNQNGYDKIGIRKGSKLSIGTNRYPINNMDLTNLLNRGFNKLIEVDPKYSFDNSLFWIDDAILNTHIISNVGMNYIEFENDPFSVNDQDTKFMYFIIDISPSIVDENRTVIVTNEIEDIPQDIEKKPTRLKDILFNIQGRSNIIQKLINAIFYNSISLLANSNEARLSLINPLEYKMDTYFKLDKNIFSSEGQIQKIYSYNYGGNINSHIITTNPYTRTINNDKTRVEWRMFKPVLETNSGLASIDGNYSIIFNPVTSVSNLKINYQPKQASIKATWNKQDSLFFNQYELRYGFIPFGTSVPDYDDQSLESVFTSTNEHTFDANKIDEEIDGDKTFILYVIAQDNKNISYPSEQSSFGIGNHKTFDIQALPEVEFNNDDIIENIYTDNTGNVLTEILLNFRLPDSTWITASENLKNNVSHFKIESRKIETPLAYGKISTLVDSVTIIDTINFGEIVEGEEISEYSNDGLDDKFEGKIISINGKEAFILSATHNSFIIDRSLDFNIGDAFTIINTYEEIGTVSPYTNTITNSLTFNKSFQYKIPVLDQGNRFRALGEWSFRIKAVNTFQMENDGSVSSIQLKGKENELSRPEFASVYEVTDGVIFEVEKPHDSDFSHFHFRAVYLDNQHIEMVDAVNISFELKSSQKEDVFFSKDVNQNGTWIFYIFSVNTSNQRSIGFYKLQLDVFDKEIKEVIRTENLLTYNTNGYIENNDFDKYLDGNYYPKISNLTVSWNIENKFEQSGKHYLTLRNDDLLNINGSTISEINDVLFDISLLENNYFYNNEENFGETLEIFGNINNDLGYTIFNIEVFDNTDFDIGDIINFEIYQSYGSTYDYINSNILSENLKLEVLSSANNPIYYLDGTYSLSDEIPLSGGLPPYGNFTFTSDVIILENIGTIINVEMITQMSSDNEDEYEDGTMSYIYFRTGSSFSDFDIENYESNPFKPFKKFTLNQGLYIQFLGIVAPTKIDSSISIKDFRLYVERSGKNIRINDGLNNHIEIVDAINGYEFPVNDIYKIIDYSGLSVIDDTIENIKKVWIDVEYYNNTTINYNIIKIYIVDSNGNKSTGKVSGNIRVL